MRATVIALVWLTACHTSTVMDLEPDATRAGVDGAAGPFGSAHQTFRVQARVTDVVTYEVSWPATTAGDFDTTVGACPLVMFIHGGFVEADQYRWLATHFASRGYCVVSPEHALDLAITESDNASIALDDLEQRPHGALTDVTLDSAVVMGHSLGGAVASFRWVADERFDGIALLASWPSEATPVEDQLGRPSLSLIGSEDDSGEATQTAFENYARFPQPAWFGVIDGMNHYDWADGASDLNLQGDGIPTRPQTETRRNALRVLDAWLDAVMRDDATAQQALDARAFPGIRETP
jgi:pimeloyl-ACP methyl ester carboxylesterase